MARLATPHFLWLHYAGPPGPARWCSVAIDRVRQSQHQGTGTPRIAFEGVSDGARRKTFYADRILGARSQGGPVDLAEIAAEGGLSKDTIVQAMMPKSSGVRTAEHGIVFEGDGSIAGWAMHVPAPFRQALDLLLTEYRSDGHTWREWTQGVPALLNFQAGDVFYDSPAVRRDAWGAATLRGRRALHVIEATPDSARPQRAKADGGCAVEVCWIKDGVVRDARRISCAQSDILEMLRAGVEAWEGEHVRGKTQQAIQPGTD